MNATGLSAKSPIAHHGGPPIFVRSRMSTRTERKSAMIPGSRRKNGSSSILICVPGSVRWSSAAYAPTSGV